MSNEVSDSSSYQRRVYTYLYHPKYQLYNKTYVRKNFKLQTCRGPLPASKMKHIRHDRAPELLSPCHQGCSNQAWNSLLSPATPTHWSASSHLGPHAVSSTISPEYSYFTCPPPVSCSSIEIYRCSEPKHPTAFAF